MHDMQKIAVDVTFTKMTSKKGIKIPSKREISAMYKYYTQLEDMNVMGELEPNRTTKPEKRGSLQAINRIK